MLCKEARMGGGNSGRSLHQSLWGQVEGVVYNKMSFVYDGGDKEWYFRLRNFNQGEFSRNWGLSTWKPDGSNLAKAFRLPVTSI